jgi:preprotein translocase subunit YajC
MAGVAYAQVGDGGGPGPLVQALPFVFVMVIMYFLIFRPQLQKAKTHRQMIDNLKRNDLVMTTGGLCGRVIDFGDKDFGDKVVILEIAPNVRVRVDRPHIELVIGGRPAKASGADKSEGKEK